MARYWFEFNFFCQREGLTVVPGLVDQRNNPELAIGISDNPTLRNSINVDGNTRSPECRHGLFLNRAVGLPHRGSLDFRLRRHNGPLVQFAIPPATDVGLNRDQER